MIPTTPRSGIPLMPGANATAAVPASNGAASHAAAAAGNSSAAAGAAGTGGFATAGSRSALMDALRVNKELESQLYSLKARPGIR